MIIVKLAKSSAIRRNAPLMKTLVSKYALKSIMLCTCALGALPAAEGAAPIAVAMTADHWQTKENAEFLKQLGFYRGLIRLNSGTAALKDVTFSNGTIEFDVNTIGRDMPGIAFRQQDDRSFELLYLRPDPSCPAFQACIQYAPQTHGGRYGTCFRDIRRGPRCARTVGTTSKWWYPAAG